MRKCVNLEARLQHQEESLKQLNSQILDGHQIVSLFDNVIRLMLLLTRKCLTEKYGGLL
jgi:uncharacterized coiled-coil protein SlyX